MSGEKPEGSWYLWKERSLGHWAWWWGRAGLDLRRGVALQSECCGQDAVTDTHLLQAHAEAAENLLHVASLLHGDHAEVVLLVHPHQEAFIVVVPKKGQPKA